MRLLFKRPVDMLEFQGIGILAFLRESFIVRLVTALSALVGQFGAAFTVNCFGSIALDTLQRIYSNGRAEH